jgi:predicted porin
VKKHRKASSKDIPGAAIPWLAGRSRSAIHAAIAVSGTVAAVGTAHAQSSVTLYGFLDEGINYTSNVQTSPGNGHSLYSMSSGVLSGSRWGLRGTEDLGGGMKALFVVENGFDVGTGKMAQGGLEFGRQAFVGISAPYGTLTLGRQYDPVVDYVHPLTSGAMFGGNIGAHPGDLDNLNNTNRVNNAVKYQTANYAGFTAEGMYSFGGVPGSMAANQIYSFGAGYARGPLNVGVGYLNAHNPNASFFGTAVGATATNNNLGSSPVINGYASAQSEAVVAAGFTYTIGAAMLNGVYSNTRYNNLSGTVSVLNPAGLSGTATFNSGEIGLQYQVTPALSLGTAYTYTEGGNTNRAKYHEGSVNVDYALSKRTDVYVIGVLQHASGTDSTGQAARASINGLSPSSTNQQATVRLALRHRF